MQANTIPSVEDIPFDVSPSTRSLLVEILSQLAAVKEEIAALREENRALRGEIASLREDSALERAHDRKRIADLEDLVEREAHDAALARQRISKLETPAPALRERTAAVTEEHQNHVKALLLREPTHRLKIKDIAPRLGLTRQQTWNIINEMERNRMVNVINDPHHRQRKLVELHQQIGTPSNY